MATLVTNARQPDTSLTWFWQLLKEELAPYPGRLALMARMVIATTIVMIMTMTFRIPYGAYGAVFALTISRESPRMTASEVRTTVFAFAAGAVYVLIGAIFFVDEPAARFVWVIATFFVMFYAVSAVADYVAAARFGYMIIITTPLWDQHLPGNDRVEGTLWAVAAVGSASLITLLLESAFAQFGRGDQVVRSVAERLESIEILLAAYGEERPVTEPAAKNIRRLDMVGTSRLRRYLDRSAQSPQYREQMGAVVALAGRLIDLAATLEYVDVSLDDKGRERARGLVENISSIRTAIVGGRIPQMVEPHREGEDDAPPLFREMEITVGLIPEAFVGSRAITAYLPQPSREEQSRRFLVRDAFTNPEHMQFGLKGCLAASLCYIAYNALFWPGISTAVTTCFLTALTTVGASHQKQLLRIGGAVVGGFGLGMGAQIFILPYLDSIAAFTVLFLPVAAISAWFATSSARLSYFGVQIAVAFFLINLSEFQIQTSLAVARDRVVGILLGLSMMWLAFDQLWRTPAGAQMKMTFVANLRNLAQFTREPLSEDLDGAIARGALLRETIQKQFGKVRSLADGVLFEFGPTRRQDLALRNHIRRWQPQLRTFFVLRNTLIKYRLQLRGFELPENVRQAQQEFDEHLARRLDDMANRLEGSASSAEGRSEAWFDHLAETVRTSNMAAQLGTFLQMSQTAENLIVSLEVTV